MSWFADISKKFFVLLKLLSKILMVTAILCRSLSKIFPTPNITRLILKNLWNRGTKCTFPFGYSHKILKTYKIEHYSKNYTLLRISRIPVSKNNIETTTAATTNTKLICSLSTDYNSLDIIQGLATELQGESTPYCKELFASHQQGFVSPDSPWIEHDSELQSQCVSLDLQLGESSSWILVWTKTKCLYPIVGVCDFNSHYIFRE